MLNIDGILKVLSADTLEDVYASLSSWVACLTGDKQPLIFLLSVRDHCFVQVGTESIPQAKRPENFVFDTDKHIKFNAGDRVIGFIEVTGGILSKNIPQVDIDLIAAALKTLFDRFYLDNFFQHIKKPLDFTNRDTYFFETTAMLADALDLEMVAIRKLTANGDLECLAFFPESGEHLSHKDFSVGQLPESFQQVLDETQQILSEGSSPSEKIKTHILNGNHDIIKTFIIFPIVIENNIFGFISCCSVSKKPIFSDVQLKAIKTTMQIVSVSINNYSNYHEAKLLEISKFDQLFNMMSLEIAQATRHELANIQHNQAFQVIDLERQLRGIKNTGVQNSLMELQNSIDMLGTSINKLRFNNPSVYPKLEKISIKKIWDEAITQVSQQLINLDIKFEISGPDIRDDFYPEWLRMAFLNLLFNSMDAFRSRPKRGRYIKLLIHPDNQSIQDYILDYTDNAGGIAYPRLVVPDNIRDGNPGLSLDEMIFKPKVTSKKSTGGSGWGLYLVRRATDMHKGSTYLFRNTNLGCTFRIILRKNLI